MVRSALLTLALAASSATPLRAASANPFGQPEGIVDRLVRWESADAFRAGEMTDTALIISDPARVELHDTNPRSFPREGRWTSPVVQTEMPITEVLPSWNVQTPEGTGIRFEVRVRNQGASPEWSPWLSIGNWGDVTHSLRRELSFDGGRVEVDTLVLSEPADAFQMRALFEATNLDAASNPTMRRMVVAYSGVVSDEARRQALMPPPDLQGANWARVIDVPHEGQGQLGRPLSGLCCSPTSTTMVLQSLGINESLLTNSLAIYDEDFQLFGNWGRAVAYAGTFGLDAWLQRFRTWDQAKAMIAQGQPIICSIDVGEGDLEGAGYTGGHLVVMRGFTPNGDPIINDPAYGLDRGRAVVYRADQFGKVWFGHGGVGYIIRPPQPR